MSEATSLADLARSGLTRKDALLMGVRDMSPEQVRKVTKLYDSTAYLLPYFDDAGKPTNFLRLRFLEDTFDKRTGKRLRYWQPPKTAPGIYFPKCVDWKEVKKDTRMPLLITEGEKKAFAGAKMMKLPVLGLGGVWSWGSKKQGTIVLPELVPYLKDREVLFVFDHEPVPNPDVTMALHQAARAVRGFGATPRCIALPPLKEGEKAGLDDVLVSKGADFVRSLTPSSFEDEAQLESLNEEMTYVLDAGAVYHFPTHGLYDRPQRFAGMMYANRTIVRYDAKGNAVEKNLAAEWLRWPHRRVHKSVVYEPGKPKALEDGSLNLWPGLAVEPKRGEVKNYLRVLDQVFADNDPKGEYRKWVTQWLAYPLQKPGVKLYSAVLMFSRLQGVGKSLLGDTMRWIYGKNFVELEAVDLHSTHNGWARHRQFVVGNEVTSRDRREDADRLKNLVTQETVRINEKFQVPYELPAKAQFWLTSNHPDALSLDPEDRRWFIWGIYRQTIDVAWYNDVYYHWVRRKETAQALLHYFLNVDLKGFDPRGHAPMTEAKDSMQTLSDSGIDYMVREMLEAPDKHLVGISRDMFRPSELASILDPSGRTHAVAVAKALGRAGVQLIKLKTPDGQAIKVYPIRNRPKWYSAAHAERVAHYSGVKLEGKKK